MLIIKITKKKGGELQLKQLVEGLLEDLSTKEVFLFRIACGVCTMEYANRPMRFSKADVIPSTPQKKIIYDAIYEQEFQSAKRSAIWEAAEQLNYCPICKRLVCNRCFLICDDLDMCKQCASDLNEAGVPVLSDMLEVAI